VYKYPVAEPEIGEEELRNVVEAVKSGWVSSKGKFIEEFENSFARYIGVKYGVATSNGTAALHLALAALGVGPGDEVVVPDLTFAATMNAVLYVGAKPVIVDVDPSYWCLDPRELEKAITERTKAVMVVHLYGHPCDMDAIMEVAERRGLYVVEDAAEAHGAEYRRPKGW
jgi:perosamine synthetase